MARTGYLSGLQLAHPAAISQSTLDHFSCTHNSSPESSRVHCGFWPTEPESGQQIYGAQLLEAVMKSSRLMISIAFAGTCDVIKPDGRRS
jgi:hypothetical protein